MRNESALFIDNIEQLNRMDISKIELIYYGSEFCEQLMPTSIEIKKFCNFCLKIKKKAVLVTPVLTNNGLKKILEIINIFNDLSEDKMPFEIVINDLGLMILLLKYKKITKTLGRLLSKQKRDPRLFDSNFVKEWKIDISEEYFNTFFLDELKNYGINRIEIDNVPTNLNLLINKKFNISLYFPYVFLTTTRLCPLNNDNPFDLEMIAQCKRKCKIFNSFILTHNAFDRVLYLCGNTLFYDNEEFKNFVNDERINRIIYEKRNISGNKNC